MMDAWGVGQFARSFDHIPLLSPFFTAEISWREVEFLERKKPFFDKAVLWRNVAKAQGWAFGSRP